jgi:hypothetical protein
MTLEGPYQLRGCMAVRLAMNYDLLSHFLRVLEHNGVQQGATTRPTCFL